MNFARRSSVVLAACAWIAFCGRAPVVRAGQQAKPDGKSVAEFHGAVVAKDLAKVKALLAASPALVASTDAAGNTPLHLAMYDAPTRDWLVDHGADPLAKNKEGAMPIDAVFDKDEEDTLVALLKHARDVNAKSRNGLSLLQSAVSCECEEAAVYLLNQQAVPAVKDEAGSTLLHLVAATEMTGLAERLVARGLDVNARNGQGKTALDVALASGNADMVELFAERKADCDVSTRDPFGRTVLHYAAGSDRVGVEPALLRGADPNARDKNGETPLFYAARSGTLEAIEALAAHKADLNARNNDGRTPAGSVPSDRSAVASWFRDHGGTGSREARAAKAAEDNAAGMAAALAAVKAAQAAQAEAGAAVKAAQAAQAEAGAVVPAPKSRPAPATGSLAAAIEAADLEQAKAIVAKNPGAVSAKDDAGETPLFLAAEAGNLSMARLLVSAGADVGVVNKNGQTAASRAESSGHPEVAAYLNRVARETK